MSLLSTSGSDCARIIGDVVTNTVQAIAADWVFGFDMEPETVIQSRKHMADKTEADYALLIV